VFANSREVNSNQRHMHPALARVVGKHLASPYRRPVPDYSLRAYEALRESLAAQARPLILDSYCGTGLSTATLARQHPDSLVVGIDKSSQRLSRQPQHGENCLFLRAQCEDIWALLANDGIVAARHYLLYPNPWPKSAHLKRRVHGHPGFQALLRVGGSVELRSNWQVYVEEFGTAMHLAGVPGLVQQVPDDGQDLTLFERKYRASGHHLWRFGARIAP